MKKILSILTLFLICFSFHKVKAQNAWQRAAHHIEYNAELQGTFSDNQTPLWLNANRYGLSSLDKSNGYLRAGIFRQANNDSTSKWRIGYGADIAVAANFTSTFVIQQLYADFDYRLVRLTVGAKEQPMAFKNKELSSGGQTFGINARPIPQVRIGLPNYWNISGRANWAAIRGYIAYGMMTDGRFAEDYAAPTANYAKKALFHAKAGYLRLGNEDKFPLTFEGGLEMACTFGGTIYNAQSSNGIINEKIEMGHSIGDFIDATFGTGGDVTDGEGYANATGNTVGSWLLRLNYKGKNWRASVYYDHFFEDHSQMFLQYGWLDGMIGAEVELPTNRFVSSLVYEYVKTTYQSGAVYHDHTAEIPDQISGRDNYYNHNLYTGWQHWGQSLGNALYVSPLYNQNGFFTFTGNRFKAHHIGINGDPTNTLHYRLLYTHERNLGTYAVPFEKARTTDSFLAEARISPNRLGKVNLEGWHLGLALGFDRGDLIGNNLGFQFIISRTGLLTK